MINEPIEMQEIHAIRLQIYEETKNLTLEQRLALTQKEAQEIIDKYHLKILRPAAMAH
ncbi:MAG: hypothetical protein LBD62_02620 [Candidatus Margulisbacteria bacterium]|jgi:hypothetical protein|nr:hypothetical protein [Candidatus Margulisiibacteriota bacterium]